MIRYLVLVDTPLRGATAMAELERLNTAAALFHIVVPARALSDDERTLLESGEGSESHEVLAARSGVQNAVDQLEKAGLNVTGAVGSENPIDAIEEALEAERFDAVVVVTEPAGIAGWVNLDLPSRIERHVSEPVVVIEIDPAT